MHFVYGGDYLFTIGTLGVLFSFVIQVFYLVKNVELKSHGLTQLYVVNSICLFIAYLGMMLKVAHVLDTQFEKDFVLDFFGIPAILISIIYIFNNIDKLMETSKSNKLIFFKQIVLPWTLFIFSFLLYVLYSVILSLI